MTRILLCTDLDRTLIPNGPQAESAAARKWFNKLTQREEVSLVYVTGRDKSLVLQAIKNYQLPVPDFVIADVGSTIYHIENNVWHHIEKWDDEIADDWNGKSNAYLQGLLKTFSDIRIQDYSRQKPHKLSYYVPLYAAYEEIFTKINACFEKENIKANLIWSIDESANIGLLDILPASANKKHAIEFLMNLYNFSLDETLFAGDSGNDISVMASPIHSVLVANATDEVKKTALKRASINNESETLYIAKGDCFGMNGNYCAGVLEGVMYYIPVVKGWLGIENE